MAATQLAAPTVKVSNITAGGAFFSWTAVPSASSYTVLVSPSSTFSTGVITRAGLTTASFGLANLAASTTYYVKAQSVGNGTTYTSSTPAVTSFKTAAAAAPVPPPTTVSVQSTDLNSATLSWTAVSGASFYSVQDSVDPNFSTGVRTTQSGTTSVRVAGQSYGVKHYYRVQAGFPAGTVIGTPQYSTAASAVLPTGITNKDLAAPINLNKYVSGQSVRVTWAPGAAQTIRSYKVLQCVDFACNTFIGYTTGTSSPKLPLATVTTQEYLTPASPSGTTYFLKIQACNDWGCGPYSATVAAVTQ